MTISIEIKKQIIIENLMGIRPCFTIKKYGIGKTAYFYIIKDKSILDEKIEKKESIRENQKIELLV